MSTPPRIHLIYESAITKEMIVAARADDFPEDANEQILKARSDRMLEGIGISLGLFAVGGLSLFLGLWDLGGGPGVGAGFAGLLALIGGPLLMCIAPFGLLGSVISGIAGAAASKLETSSRRFYGLVTGPFFNYPDPNYERACFLLTAGARTLQSPDIVKDMKQSWKGWCQKTKSLLREELLKRELQEAQCVDCGRAKTGLWSTKKYISPTLDCMKRVDAFAVCIACNRVYCWECYCKRGKARAGADPRGVRCICDKVFLNTKLLFHPDFEYAVKLDSDTFSDWNVKKVREITEDCVVLNTSVHIQAKAKQPATRPGNTGPKCARYRRSSICHFSTSLSESKTDGTWSVIHHHGLRSLPEKPG